MNIVSHWLQFRNINLRVEWNQTVETDIVRWFLILQTLFGLPPMNGKLESIVRDKLRGRQRLTSEGAVVISLPEPLENGMPVIVLSAPAHDRIPHDFQADGTDELIGNVHAFRVVVDWDWSRRHVAM
eukprot:scaffold2068_cov96-Cylindrotheca_fusiformis.AAC.8